MFFCMHAMVIRARTVSSGLPLKEIEGVKEGGGERIFHYSVLQQTFLVR